MLSRTHKILIGMLVVQIALAIVMFARGGDVEPAKARSLLALDAAKVTMLQVGSADPAKPPVQLVKQGTGWVVKSSYDYPAKDTKVSDVLVKLTKLAAASPIATQANRHKQLRVADTDFERKIVITADGKDTILFVGNAAGARRTAVRLGGATDVYAVGLDSYALGSESREWVDTTYVAVPKSDLAKITLTRGASTLELVPEGTTWKATLDGVAVTPAAGESLEPGAIDRLVDAATSIELAAPADPKRAGVPTATLVLERKAQPNASAVPVTIDIVADGTAYWVHDRARPNAVTVEKSRLAELLEVTRDKLVKKADPAEVAPTPKPGNG
jgi:hypothetical protein